MAPFEAIQTSSLVEEAYAAIRKAILSSELRAGAPVLEAAIAREMGISRGPIREALRLLEQGGLVTREPNRGLRVASFTEEDLLEFASLRLALEGLAIRDAMANPDLVPRLHAIREEMHDAAAAGDRARAVSLDRQFHETMVQLSGHRRLLTVWSLLRDQIELAVAEVSLSYRTLAGRADSHLPLLQALERRDPEEALARLEAHIYDAEILGEARRGKGRPAQDAAETTVEA